MLTAFFKISLSCRNISFSRCNFLISSSIPIWCPFPGKASSPCSPNSLHHLFRALSEIPRSLAICVLLFPLMRKEINRLLLEFFGIGRLSFAHNILLLEVYHISLLRPPNFGGIPKGFCLGICLPSVAWDAVSRRIGQTYCTQTALQFYQSHPTLYNLPAPV